MNHIVTEAMVCSNINSSYIRKVKKNMSEAPHGHPHHAVLPLPPLKMQMPPSLPSWILFLLSVGLLSVLIHTPAMALSKISLSSMKPRPVEFNSTIRVKSICTLFGRPSVMNEWHTDLSCRLKSLHSGLPRFCCAWSLGCSPSFKDVIMIVIHLPYQCSGVYGYKH